MSKDGNKKEKSDYRIGISGIIPCKQDDYVCVANKLQSKEGSKSVEEFASFLKNEISKELSTKPELKKKFPTTSRVFIWIIQFLKDKNKSCQGDIDNMARTILNSLEGVIYKDDKQVSELYVCKQENFNRLNDNFIYIGIKEIKSENNSRLFKLINIEEAIQIHRLPEKLFDK